MEPTLIVHGHFYQPPRENPWTEAVAAEPSAAPFHDWNERITAECYRPNGWARILDDHGRIVAIVDNYRRLSFDMGPTLLSWLEDHAPQTYDRIVAADVDGLRSAAFDTGTRRPLQATLLLLALACLTAEMFIVRRAEPQRRRRAA